MSLWNRMVKKGDSSKNSPPVSRESSSGSSTVSRQSSADAALGARSMSNPNAAVAAPRSTPMTRSGSSRTTSPCTPVATPKDSSSRLRAPLAAAANDDRDKPDIPDTRLPASDSGSESSEYSETSSVSEASDVVSPSIDGPRLVSSASGKRLVHTNKTPAPSGVSPQQSPALASADDLHITRLKRVYGSCVSLAANVMNVHDCLQNLGDSCGAYLEEIDEEDEFDEGQAMCKIQELVMRVDALLLALGRSFQDTVLDSFSQLPHGIPDSIGASTGRSLLDSSTIDEDTTVAQSISIQTLKNFQALHQSLDEFFSGGSRVVKDFKPHAKEFHRTLSTIDTSVAIDASPVEPERKTALDIHACIKIVVDVEKMYLGELNGLAELQTRLSDPSMNITPNDFKAIFRNLDDIIKHESKLIQSLQMTNLDKDPCAAFCKALSASFADGSALYVPFVQGSSYCVEALSHYNKSSKVQKEITVFCARSALSGKSAMASFEDSLEEPYRHMFQLKNTLERVQDSVSPNSEEWSQLQATIERCSTFISQLDEANLQSQQIKSLFFLRPRFPEDCDSIVTYCREYMLDGKLTVLSFSSDSETEDDGKSLNGAAFQEHGHYHAFLFNDILLFCTGKKKGSSKHALKVFCRLPVDSIVATHNVCLQKANQFTIKFPSGELFLETKNSESMQLWMKTLTRAATNRQRTMVIGVSLENVLSRPSERNCVVPSVVENALQCIEKYGLDHEGIFRVTKSKIEIDNLRTLVDSGRPIFFIDPILASLLVKRWLTALPEPLLLYKRTLQDWFDARGDTEKLQGYVEELGKMRNSVLYRVVDVLSKIAANSSVNKMTTNALSIIFGMIFFPTVDPKLTNLSTETFQVLLENSDTIFKEIRASELTRQSSLKSNNRRARLERRERLRTIAANRLSGNGSQVSAATSPVPNATSPQPVNTSGGTLVTSSSGQFLSHPLPRKM